MPKLGLESPELNTEQVRQQLAKAESLPAAVRIATLESIM